MTFTAIALLCLVPAPSITAAAPVAPILAVADDELDELLTERGEAADGMSLAEIWQEAQKVATLVGDTEGPPFDAALDRKLRATGASGKATLFFAAARRLGDDVDYEVLGVALQPLLDDADDGVAMGAADLLGSPEFQQQPPDVRESITDALLAVATDGDRDPILRVECAVSAHQIGLGGQVVAARTELYGFLDSSDPTLRARGALGMAHLGIIENVSTVEPELRRLASLPGEDGRLADSYLKQLEIRRYKDTELRRERERARNRGVGEVPADLEAVDNLIMMVKEGHLEGEKVTRDQLVEAALDGILRSMDRHSSYFPPAAYKKFEQDLEAEYGGIGAYVGEDPDDRLFTITRPIYSGPAYKAGLTTDDKIVRIGDWPTIGEKVDEIIKRLKGRPGTDVKLYVWRRGMDPGLIDRPTEDMVVEIERGVITIPPVHYEMLPGKIGLVELTTFSRVAHEELEKAFTDLQNQGVRGLIFDLRNNTGGLLREAQNVADLFLPPGKLVVKTESRLYETKEYKTRKKPFLAPEVPVVVLINRFSASASEIVAGALQDHKRATLIGQRSFGKGSVQNLFALPGQEDDGYSDENKNRRYDNWEPITKDRNGNGEFDYGGRVKLTIERWLLPTGRSIHRELDDEGTILSPGGVDPDTEIAPTRREGWKLVEMRKIQNTRVLREWVGERFEANKDLFEQLAHGDVNDTGAYPEFDELYASLDTVLSPEDVRFLLRMEVRRRVQDSRGHAFPMGDYQEDVQLQRGLIAVLEELGETTESIEAYAATFEELDDAGKVVAQSTPVASGLTGRLDDALTLIAAARDGDAELSAKELQELGDLLKAMKGRN